MKNKNSTSTKPVSSDIIDEVYEKRRKARRFQLMVVLVILVLLLSIGNAAFSVFLYTSSIRDERIKMADGTASLAATFIDTEKVDNYLENGKTEPGYKETQDVLRNILRNANGVTYLYVVKIDEDGCHFVFDTDTEAEGSLEAYEPGEVIPFEDAFKPYLPALFEGKPIDPIESNDVSGWVITVYHPVYDNAGKCVCYVGADVSLDDVSESITHFLIRVVLWSALFLVLILSVAAWLSHNYQKITEWEALAEKQEQSKQLIREIVTAFSKTVDMKDKYTNGHSFRVAKYTAMLTKELGYDEETVEKYYNIALMHDIGKIGIPEEVLNKPRKLTDEEFAIIKSHTVLGYNVLKDIGIMPDLAEGAVAHHERPDGKGYPKGLKQDEIPRVAQIIAVADTFDAMYSNRPYRKRMNFEKAVSIIKEVSGTQLTSDVVDAFLRLVDQEHFRAPDDHGGGTTEDINNIRKKFENEDKNE